MSSQSNNIDKTELKSSYTTFLSSLRNYLKNIFNLQNGVDINGSVESIKQDIDFKGHTVWILGASIVLASIGLNVNSNALIIGAMLISPLMGPIVGIGYSIGTNDWETLIRSLKNLGTAVLISVLVSYLYFLISPFGDVQSELIARTEPTLLDVLVALFGGIALVVARTKKGTIASVIMGVAIATALMPPLCTVGFAIAHSNWSFFFGAFYLFLINSVFIAISTWFIIKYLKFPLVSYIDSEKQKKIKRYIYLSSMLVILPSAYTFYVTINKTMFNRKVEQFIADNINLEKTKIINKVINYNHNDTSLVEIFTIGNPIPETTIEQLSAIKKKYGLENVNIKIFQSNSLNTDISELENKISGHLLENIIIHRSCLKLNNW